MKFLERLQLLLSGLVILAPAAHALELPNKLLLDGPNWLSVQQHLYRGWGPVIGAPTEIGACVTSIAMVVLLRQDRTARSAAVVAAAAYAGMIDAFFLFNAPVNNAITAMTPATLPPVWPALRLRWEAGHVIAAILALVALATTVRAWLRRHPRVCATTPPTSQAA